MKGDNVSVVLLDMDGVIVDFHAGVFRAHGIVNPYLNGNGRGVWDIAGLVGMAPADFWRPCGHDFWANLPWTIDGFDLLEMAERAVGAENVYLLTSPTLDAGAYSGKAAWVQGNLPDYYRRLLVGPCKHLCASPRHLLIDDSDANVQEFTDHGGQAILVPRPWNALWSKQDEALSHVKNELVTRL